MLTNIINTTNFCFSNHLQNNQRPLSAQNHSSNKKPLYAQTQNMTLHQKKSNSTKQNKYYRKAQSLSNQTALKFLQKSPNQIPEHDNRNNLNKNQQESTKQLKQGQIMNIGIVDNNSVLLNFNKIVLPIKQYSNKFLAGKANKSVDNTNCANKGARTLIKPRRQTYYRENISKSMKTENNHSISESMMCTNTNICGSTEIKSHKVDVSSQFSQLNLNFMSHNTGRLSTSRALQKFSKVFRNERVQRIKMRKQVKMNKTSEVQIKQVTLHEKEDNPSYKKQKSSKDLANSKTYKRKPRYKKQICKNTWKVMDFIDDENFQLAGW